MNENWKQFLTDQGAIIENGRVVSFAKPEGKRCGALEDNVLCDLSHFGLIRVTGDDAQAFLHGQFSNDVKAVNATHHQLSSYNSAKGRMYSSFRLFMMNDAYYLRMPADVMPAVLKRLRMFVLRSKVVLDDASDALARFGLSGPGAESLLKSIAGAVPANVDDALAAEGITVLRVPGIHPRYEIHGDSEKLAELWRKLATEASPADADAWTLLDIHAGIPNIYASTMEEFVAQMVNLHAINGVSFTKGCYPGQEIVARMHYLGKLKKRMYRVHVDGVDLPKPKDDVFESGTENKQSIGQIVDAVASPNGGFDALAVLQIGSAESAALCLGSENGPSLVVQDLPYEVTNAA